MQIIKDTLDLSMTMYPSIAHNIKSKNKIIKIPRHSTSYGYQISGETTAEFSKKDVRTIKEGQYFSLTSIDKALKLKVCGHVAIFVRLGYKGQNLIGGPTEKSGRLVYIDGCSDSLLVYPPRLGDPSISLLHFPMQVEQKFHIHPSIRLGVVIEGSGIAEIKRCNYDKNDTEEIMLTTNSVFFIEERELHRFKTTDSTLKIIAYHPDGDWGPTDENHSMLNRTYVK